MRVVHSVLITGAAGFFGSALVRAFALAGVDVTATDRTPSDRYLPREDVSDRSVRYVSRDLAAQPLGDLVEGAELVVHAAALTPPVEDGPTGDELLRVNLVPLAALLRSIRTSTTCRRLVYVSSAGVFDQTRDTVLHEDDADGGTSLYGAAKLAGELVAHRYGALYDIETASVRPTSLFGAGEVARSSRPRTTALARLVDHARRSEAVAITSPSARTDWLSVDDAADAVTLLAAASELGGTAYNLSSAIPRPFSDVVAAVAAVTGLEQDDTSEHVVGPGPDRPAVIANERLIETIAWHPRRSLEDGVRDLVLYLDSGDALGVGAAS